MDQLTRPSRPEPSSAVAPARLLLLDAGSGKGGASRSLLYLVRAMDRARYVPTAVLLDANPLQSAYRDLGTDVVTLPEIPRFRPGERKNAVAFAHFLWRMSHFAALRASLAQYCDGSKLLLHCNHENLAIPGFLLARALHIPWVCHIRTTLAPGFAAARTYRFLARRCDHLFFISEPNRTHFERLAGALPTGRFSIVHNPFERPAAPAPQLTLPPEAAGKMIVAFLATLTPNRGADRVLEVATWMSERGRKDFYFVICGSAADEPLAGKSRSQFVTNLRGTVEQRGLGDQVHFAGHVARPETILSQAGVLLKLGRENAPWGRDIIEALHYGVPAIALGTFQGFVADGVTGFLEPSFDAERIGRHLIALRDAPAQHQEMRRQCQLRAREIFSRDNTVGRVEDVYARLLVRL